LADAVACKTVNVPICVAGMPCSGTSLVAGILRELGLDLAAADERADDAPDVFSRLNDDVLAALGAAWDSPPEEASGWVGRPELEPLRRQAAAVADALALVEPWGWADPRNTLTLPFWRELFPDMRVVLCVRHPLEVAASLERLGSASVADGLSLWQSYYGMAARLRDDSSVVTDYARYEKDAHEEAARVAQAVGLRPSRAAVARAVASLPGGNGDQRPADEELPRNVDDLYRTLLEAAAAKAHAPRRRLHAPARELPEPPADERATLEAQRRELEHLRLELARRRGQAETLQVQLGVRAASERELTKVIEDQEEQLLQRDAEIAALREDLGRRLHAEDALRRAVDGLRRAVDALEAELASVKPTLLWRVGMRYWALKRAIRQSLGREQP
jgi:hypothetical protein